MSIGGTSTLTEDSGRCETPTATANRKKSKKSQKTKAKPVEKPKLQFRCTAHLKVELGTYK